MDNLLRRTGRLLFGRLMPRIAYPVFSGPLRSSRFVLGSMAGDGGGASVYFNRIETEQTVAMLRELRKGQVFFDIGANVGYYTILASRLVGQGTVVACEPVIRNVAYLHRHVVLNEAANVRILAFACSDKNSTARFSAGPNVAVGHIASNEDEDGDTVLVPTITLDTLADEMQIMPDVIKIDVEGAEIEVLRGGGKILAEARPAIFLSTHSPELRESCLKLLGEIGYEIEPLVTGNDPHEFLARHAK